MKAVLELHFEETVSVELLQDVANRAMKAITGDGPRVEPRLLVELGPNYLEIPLRPTRPLSKSEAV